jgi:isopenicillin-N N-acyltransferase like protein
MVETARRQVIDCAGSPAEIGEAHGEFARDLIGSTIDSWLSLVAGKTESANEAFARFLGATSFMPAIETHTPGLLDELRGIARGANQPFETLLVYNLMDEEWSFRTGRLGQAPGCTAIAVHGVGIAQTMDIPSVHDGSQLALRIRTNTGPGKIVFTGAGMLGLNGANASGVGVVVNNLAQLPSSASGLPVMFVMRSVLDHLSAASAAAWVKSVPHAIGQHYLIGDSTQILSLEAAANGVFDVPVPDHYVHANHPLANPDSGPDAARQEAASNTHARANQAIALSADATTQAEIEATLEDREAPISCAKREGFMTFGGTSIALTSPPTVRIAFGPPHENPWTTVAFNHAPM